MQANFYCNILKLNISLTCMSIVGEHNCFTVYFKNSKTTLSINNAHFHSGSDLSLIPEDYKLLTYTQYNQLIINLINK